MKAHVQEGRKVVCRARTERATLNVLSPKGYSNVILCITAFTHYLFYQTKSVTLMCNPISFMVTDFPLNLHNALGKSVHDLYLHN